MASTYRCADCNCPFPVELTDDELRSVLRRDHRERCPKCGQQVGRRRVTCPECGGLFELDVPHWHVSCDLAFQACPHCQQPFSDLCIC